MTKQTVTLTLAAALLAALPAGAQPVDRTIEAQERALAAAMDAASAVTASSQQAADARLTAQRVAMTLEAARGFAWAPQTSREGDNAALRAAESAAAASAAWTFDQARDVSAQRAADEATRERERAMRDRRSEERRV